MNRSLKLLATAWGSSEGTALFVPGEFYGEPHKKNGTPKARCDLFYFTVVHKDEPKDALSAYVSRASFDWLAERLGVPVLVGLGRHQH